jgi:hypothetical protein
MTRWNARSRDLATRGLYDAAGDMAEQEHEERRRAASDVGACPACFRLDVEGCEACGGTGEA